MNIIKEHLAVGLKAWQKKGAKISYLKHNKIKVPQIFISAGVQSDKLFLICSGFHLEETSGPLFLLNPHKSLASLKRILKETNVVIFPVINQYGLRYPENSQDKFLRYNHAGLNYSSAWGYQKRKCREVKLVEERLIELHKKYEIVFTLSLHEDSTEVGKGYVWINNIVKPVRKIIQSGLEKKVDNRLLLKMKSTLGLRKGKIEKGFSIIDAKDDSFESFSSDILGIPTLLSEAPFGLELKKRIAFHKASLSSIPI